MKECAVDRISRVGDDCLVLPEDKIMYKHNMKSITELIIQKYSTLAPNLTLPVL